MRNSFFSAEFAKRQYRILYNTTAIQGYLPKPVYPEISLFVKSEIERLALSDPLSLTHFLAYLKGCLEYVEATKNEGSKNEQVLKNIYHGDLVSVYKAIKSFVEKTYHVSPTQSSSLPLFMAQTQASPIDETYVASELPSAMKKAV